MPEEVVVDASAMVDLLMGGALGEAVAAKIAGHALHGPSHLDAEVLSVLGRLGRAGVLDDSIVPRLLEQMAEAPIKRHPVQALLLGAWALGANLRLADALYIELASSLELALITTDTRLSPLRPVEVVTV
jgi:predicted nucleic acid-binding protein